jgi:sterol desaturase/sphingolipid hydroxylase (fatty acid hydroxylase superfamily)
MAAGNRSGADTLQVWLERVVFAGFAATMTAEWWKLRERPKREFGDLDRATREELSDASLPRDSVVPLGYERRDTAASLAALAGSVLFNELVWAKPLGALDRFAFRHRRADVGRAGKGVVGFAAAMVAWDLLYYWEHRLMHEVRVMWAHHVTHHSSERYNLSTALRQPWSSPVSHWVFLPMPLLGFSPAMTRKAAELNLLYQYWIHTEAVDRLSPRLEGVLNTPSHHRVHHGANPQYIDKNYGGVLIVFDRLFGTCIEERDDLPCRYGLVHPMTSHNPFRVELAQWIALVRDLGKARSLRTVVGTLVMPPGWAAVGVGETTEELRARGVGSANTEGGNATGLAADSVGKAELAR